MVCDVFCVYIFVCLYVQPPVDVVVSGPEVEVFDVELVKDNVGLGITIAGYISDKPNGVCDYITYLL